MRAKVLSLFVALAVVVGGLLPSAAASGADAPPPSTPGRTGPPSAVAVLGDSISTATGTGTLGGETPANSWSTGTNSAVNSTYQRLLSINPAISGRRANMATNGRRMEHMAAQAASMPTDTELVEVQLGGNDLCRPSVAEMTSVEQYRAQFVAGLQAISDRAPDALISAYTVPDIFNLWYIRYAPDSYNGQESSQAGWARLYVNLSVIPCLALLEEPASVEAHDMDRRFQVRARNMAYNEVIIEECEKVLRCRHDGGATFDLTSNRGADGQYLPRSQWRFVDDDISRNTAIGCPLTGAFASGCGDHFHPSLQGQVKLAEGAWELGRDWSDAVAPEVVVTPPPAGSSSVMVTASDAGGVRGIEHRIGGGPWEATLGGSLEVELSTGTHHLEARALDVNGNMSDSQVVTVTVADAAQVTGTVTAPTDLTGTLVGAFAADGVWPVAVVEVETATSTSGTFRFDGLAGDHQFWIVPPAGSGLLSRWVGGDQDRAGGSVHAVGDEPITLSTTELDPGGAISGTVTDGEGVGIAGVTVGIWGPDDLWLPRTQVTTGADGTYTSSAVVPGDYRVRFDPPPGSGFTTRWFGGMARHEATEVTVSGTDVTTPIDIRVHDSSISGVVTGPGGAPLAGVWVHAYASTDVWVGSVRTHTDAEGRYRLDQLAPGAHLLRFVPPAGTGLAARWYDGSVTRGGATPVMMAEGSHLTDADALFDVG